MTDDETGTAERVGGDRLEGLLFHSPLDDPRHGSQSTFNSAERQLERSNVCQPEL